MSIASAPLLSMQGISKYFAGVPALRDASLGLQAGEVHALIGQNGAGKSTMIKVMTGAYALDGPQDAGRIQFEGRDVHFKSPKQARESGISTIYQEINLVPFASVAENIFLGREPRRLGLIDWPRIHREAQRAVASVGLSVDIRQPVSSLSTAAQQMVAIARAVSVDAKLVIMDESTSSLDDREVELLFGVIRQLKADGRTVVFVSHRLDELYAICDRVTVMRDGQTVHVSPMAAISKLDLVTTMLGKELSAAHRSGAAHKHHTHQAPLLQAQALQAAPKLRSISLDVQPGETVGLAGLLGSGRTETMRLLFGADQPDGGTLHFNGQPVAFRAPADAIAQGIAYLSEDRKIEGIFPELSVRENMTMVLLPQLARLGVVNRAAQLQVVDRFIAQLGIKTSGPEQPIKELSGGNQQKVLLARWLALSPKLLLLDEPTRGIDVGAKADIANLVHALAAKGVGILMSASELEELVSMGDRVVVLRDGSSIAEISGDVLSEQAIMSAIAEGRHTQGATVHG